MSIGTPPSTGPLPSDYSFGDGYNAGNLIAAGSDNKIQESRRCTIINGAGNFILGKYNTHIIGDFVSRTDPNGKSYNTDELLNNAFYIGCMNGLHSFGDVVAFAASDERLKDNIKLIKKPLSKILSLDPVEFDWNEKQETYKGHDIGLIAQQVEAIAPELVTTRSNGYKAIKYDKLNSLLVGAIKEQQQQIESLQKQVSELIELNKSKNS
jgi:2C-methyl-D-erythritol 2,4-cyclodiphosphate synthase